MGFSKEKVSLWNVVHKKWRAVHAYIERLVPEPSWSREAVDCFNDAMRRALCAESADGALRVIGYEFRKRPALYERCWKVDEQSKKRRASGD